MTFRTSGRYLLASDRFQIAGGSGIVSPDNWSYRIMPISHKTPYYSVKRLALSTRLDHFLCRTILDGFGIFFQLFF